jgi:hypothetical protein
LGSRVGRRDELRSDVARRTERRIIEGCQLLLHGAACYLRVLFVQAPWVVLIRPKSWERYGLKPWIDVAKTRLHHNVLAIALANKLAGPWI